MMPLSAVVTSYALFYSFVAIFLCGMANAATDTADNIGIDETHTGMRRLKDDKAQLREVELGLDTPWHSMLVNSEKIVETCGSNLPPFSEYSISLKQDIMNKYGKKTYEEIMAVMGLNLPFLVVAYKYASARFDASEEVLGLEEHGELDKIIKDSHRKLDGFYGSTDLLALHGHDLADSQLLRQTISWADDTKNPLEARKLATSVQNTIESTIGYRHPLLTLNAYSLGTKFIAIGDGIFDFFHSPYVAKGLHRYHPTTEEVSLSTLAKNALLHAHAHEFGHIRQIQLGLRDTSLDPTPDTTRYFELLSDASSAYFQASSFGSDLSVTSIYDVYAASFGLGDCQIEKDTHHGTPAQRECAAFWGASVALEPDDLTYSVGSQFEYAFAKRFEDVYDNVLKLDKNLCPMPTFRDAQVGKITVAGTETKKALRRKKRRRQKRMEKMT